MNTKQFIQSLSLFVVMSLLYSCSDSGEDADPCVNGPQLRVEGVIASVEGSASGEINASATGGQAPLMFSIDGSNFQSDGSFTGLEADDYQVTVKDANDCTDSEMVTVEEVPEVLYATQIRPIIDQSCQISNCHGDNQGIPSFATYNDVRANAAGIKSRTSAGTMPPSGPLPDEQIALISDWVDQGAPNN